MTLTPAPSSKMVEMMLVLIQRRMRTGAAMATTTQIA